MTTNENWKPGDVAIVDGPDKRRLPITFFKNEDRGELMFNNGCGYQHPVRNLASTARRLVVIDPEDREAVVRLAGMFCHARWDHTGGGDECDPLTFSSMQAALREFANPTPPKPKEPLAGGSQVREADGTIWTRVEGQPGKPWVYSGSDATYASLDVVEVLR